MSVFVLEVSGAPRAAFDAADAREAEQFAFGALLAREPAPTHAKSDALVRNAWAAEHEKWQRSRPEGTDGRWICYFHEGWTERWSDPIR